MGQLVGDISAWAGNVSTSVAIVFVNKILMNATGYGFKYATTLCALHYIACSLSIWTMQTLGGVKRVALPISDLILFTATANVSIVSLNLSLMLNQVGFYQIAKLLIIPFVCLVERCWLGRVFTKPVILSVLTVVTGVAIVTVSDVPGGERNLAGVLVAGLSVLSSGMQQIFCRSMQQKHGLASHELLANTAPAQGWSLLLVGPFLDRYVSSAWVFNWAYSTPGLAILALSCTCAVGVNISQFACLGRFSAVSFQVLGHSKTILVLLGGWAFLGDRVSGRQAFGMALAVAGMVAYGVASSQPTVGKKNSNAEEAVALLPAKGAGTATAHVVVQHSARHANHSPNNKLGARLGAARTPTKDDIV